MAKHTERLKGFGVPLVGGGAGVGAGVWVWVCAADRPHASLARHGLIQHDSTRPVLTLTLLSLCPCSVQRTGWCWPRSPAPL